MRIVITFLALVPLFVMGAIFLDGWEMAWFESFREGIETTFGIRFPVPENRLYYLSGFSGLSAVWVLIAAFWVNPLRTYLRFDLVEFKKLLGAFAVGYGLLHLLLFLAAHRFDIATLGRLFGTHLFLAAGLGALLVMAIAPHVKAWYKLLYVGVVLVIVHLLLGYRTLAPEHIWMISLLSLGLALRLIKR